MFSLPLARKFERVCGVEASERAIELARKNAESARLANIEFFAANTTEFFQNEELPAEQIDFVLLDPPRAGADGETLDALLKLKAAQISYVSCDPATLARDLKRLTAESYDIESITAVDLFPQTHHVETIVRLKLKT